MYKINRGKIKELRLKVPLVMEKMSQKEQCTTEEVTKCLEKKLKAKRLSKGALKEGSRLSQTGITSHSRGRITQIENKRLGI